MPEPTDVDALDAPGSDDLWIEELEGAPLNGDGDEDYLRMLATGDDDDDLAELGLTTGCTYEVQAATPPLHARQRRSDRAPSLAALPNETVLTVQEHRGPWLRITAPHAGWVRAMSVHRRCAAGEQATDALP